MDCYAWKIPEGCYASELAKAGAACPSVSWWWLAAAIAAGALVFGGKKKRTKRAARKR